MIPALKCGRMDEGPVETESLPSQPSPAVKVSGMPSVLFSPVTTNGTEPSVTCNGQNGSSVSPGQARYSPRCQVAENMDVSTSLANYYKQNGGDFVQGENTSNTSGMGLPSFEMDYNNDVSDGESFDGKIVYNPDGSAYIIEGGESDLSDGETGFDVPKQEGSIIETRGKIFCAQSVPSFPQIANAFYIQRNNTNFFHNVYNMYQESRPRVEAPIMHSYRVYDFRQNKKSDKEHDSKDQGLKHSNDALTVPTKPILMCFICKLSFGYSKSFIAHAISEHNMTLLEKERDIMSHKNASAIIQGLGRDKEPLMSFLEPISVPKPAVSTSSHGFSQLPSASGHLSTASTRVTYAQKLAVSSSADQPKSPQWGITMELEGDPVCNGAGSENTAGHINQGAMSDSVASNRSFQDHESCTKVHTTSSPRSCDLDHHVSGNGAENTCISSKDGDMNLDTSSPNHSDRTSVDTVASNSSGAQLISGPMGIMGEVERSVSPSASPENGSAPSSATSPKLPLQQGLVITGCEDHPNGKQQGVDCNKCDLMMESSRSLGNQLGLIHSRNSCKTLKCPKCNWHYKYQETLEIHMKEKHPDNDTQCIYCITNQPHPRLSRGEVYTCGYKPYRCEVCNYSTTTKGNLSIHMQSDKHINNMQELQKVQAQNGPPPPVTIATPQPVTPDVNAARKATSKPKPTWRCDVCNYETNVARNLRIHMTSEKHTHNMMMLQQNMKTMQRDMQMHLTQMGMFGQEAPVYPMSPFPQPGFPHFPVDQAAMFMLPQLAHNPTPNMDNPMNLTKETEPESHFGDQSLDVKNNNNQPSKLFFCAVCNVYSCDTIEELHQHMQLDRSRSGDGENVVITSGNYMCKLCTYKTNLKANFQLHCKTDKHMQRLQLVNHIREGGPANEWLVKYMNATNPVQIKCTACDYFTNSIGKLQVHTTDPRHEASSKLYHYLQQKEAKVEASTKAYVCTICEFAAKTKMGLVQHIRSNRHARAGREEMMKLAEQGKEIQLSFDALYDVREYRQEDDIQFDDDIDEESFDSPESDVKQQRQYSPAVSETKTNDSCNTPQPGPSSGEQIHMCPYCNYSSISEMRIEAHIISQHMQRQQEILCPLCQDNFPEKTRLEKHLVQVHSVTMEGLQRLLMLVEEPQQGKAGHPAAAVSPAASQSSPAFSMPPLLAVRSPSDTHSTPTSIPPSSTPSHSGGSAQLQSLGQHEGDVSPGGAGGCTPVTSAAEEMVDERAEMIEKEALKIVEEATKDGVYLSDKDGDDQFRCQMCSKIFINIDDFYSHQNELGHLELKQTPRGPGYLCWKKGCNQYFKTAQTLQVHFREIHAKQNHVSVSERHVYKFRCNQCSLAFRTSDKLQLHSKYHAYRAATQCHICERNFRSIAALQKHVESWHLDNMSSSELDQYKSNLMAAASLFGSTPLNGPSVELTSISPAQEFNLSCLNKDQKSPGFKTKDTCMEIPIKIKLEGNESPNPENTQASLEDSGYRENTCQEDYLNSQAIAEGSYEDPTRKYKCHRCKVAFTKQSYLSAHNKTVMHRKGDKMSYPMEKYLDPNRPYKCETCKESFTQKNILLVHYNSVSHLHKLKQVAQNQQPSYGAASSVIPPTSQILQQQQQTSGLLSPTPQHTREISTPSPQPPRTPVKSSMSPVAISTPNPVATSVSSSASPVAATSPGSSPETEDKKPFKCNICKVAYSQSTTLDIHMRSVLHQTRASKLHELVMAGQVDLGQPLIEQPEPCKSGSHKKALADMIQQKKSDSPDAGCNNSVPKTTSGSSNVTSAADVKPTTSQLEATAKMIQNEQERIELYASQALAYQQAEEAMYQQQQHFQNLFQQSMPQQDQTSVLKAAQATQASANPQRFIPRNLKPHLHKSLLENFGFECVMQFNEYHQRRKKKEMKEDAVDKTIDDQENKENEIESVDDSKRNEEDKKIQIEFPEVNKSLCKTCCKEFSSIWVLKAHQEEIHKEIVDLDLVEEFGEKLRKVFEKKIVNQQTDTSSTENPVNGGSNNEQTKSLAQTPVEGSLPATPTTPFDLNSISAQMMQMPMFGMMPFPVPMGVGMTGINVPMAVQPPFMPMMMMPPGMDSGIPGMPMMDPAMVAAQRAAQEQANNAKRVRTRINDEQLKILRAHFDINNSPNEDQIMEMADKSGLPAKVIKHWFRNTLFKERQRNKDSPYNFNVPPATSINLEEYEKTGKVTVGPSPDGEKDRRERQEMDRQERRLDMLPPRDDDIRVKLEKYDKYDMIDSIHVSACGSSMGSPCSSISSTPTPSTPKTTMPSGLLSPLVSPSSLPGHSMAAKYVGYQNSHPSMPKQAQIPKISPSQHSPCMNMSMSASKRANRTRFSDHQIKVLQEYFERNAYPKDDDLEQLSKMLGLSPRVIVVWFQNARQKARKSYENQPPLDLTDDGTRFNRTPGLNYQCKKCMTVFQRYFELIKHQQTQCYKDEPNDKPFLDERRGSASTISSMPSPESSFQGEESQQEKSGAEWLQVHVSTSSSQPSQQPSEAHSPRMVPSQTMFSGYSQKSAFAMLQNVAQQSQQQQQQEEILGEVHYMNENTPSKRKAEVIEDDHDDQPRDKRLRTTILPEQLDYLYQQYQLDCNPSRKQLEDISTKVGLKKRVVQVWFQNTRARERKGQYRAHQQLIHKRCPFCRALFRAKSALESHLATKHPEEMAKGDINVDNIPDAADFPPPESPSTSNNSQQGLDMAKLMANPYNIPNPFMGLTPNVLPPGNDPLQMNMSQLYQDSFKKYIDKLSGASHQPKTSSTATSAAPTAHTSNKSVSRNEDTEAPLDLSKPVKLKTDGERKNDTSNRTEMAEFKGYMDDSRSETHSESTENDFNDSGSVDASDSAPPSPNIPGRHLIPAKRYRTQMNSLQIRVMKNIFVEYKTPTMAECEMLGHEIGLPKRVIQVWFQNARAKEKKTKLSYPKSFGGEVELPRQTDECRICNFKYSHKYTIQDHLFTKKHLENVKRVSKQESDGYSNQQVGLQASRGVEQAVQSLANKASMSAHPQLAHLQAMGLQAMSMPGPMANLTASGSSLGDTKPREDHKKSQDLKVKQEPWEESKKKESTDPPTSTSSSDTLHAQMAALAGMYPGAEMGAALSQMMGYPGMSNMYPPAMPGFQMMQPFMPGPDMYMYDPTIFGTPLALLQIPPEAIKIVQGKVQDQCTTVTSYTQDCKSLNDLKEAISEQDFKVLRGARLDVGYICKKCSMVYPGKEACQGHQQTVCFQGKNPCDVKGAILKLEQMQYECCACKEKCSTQREYKNHCSSDGHKQRVVKFLSHTNTAKSEGTSSEEVQ